ncbi:MAG: hypothetical protein E7131_00350 [Rikenellaceae bacterium]|nr:hypothetical protein [Rikenellaceae bacterium]
MKKILFSGIALLAALLCGCSDATSTKPADTTPSIEISGESIPSPMDVVFKVMIKNATKASYVIYDTTQHEQEEALGMLNYASKKEGAVIDGFSLIAGNIPLEQTGATQDFSINDMLLSKSFLYITMGDDQMINNHLFSMIVRAQDENGDEVCVSHDIKALAQPSLYLSKGLSVVVNMDNNTMEENSTEENVAIAYKNSQYVCWFVTDDLEKEFTAQEVFEVAQNIAPAKQMGCLVCDAEEVLIEKTNKTQILWCAVSNDIYYAVKSYMIAPLDCSEIGFPSELPNEKEVEM